MIYNSKAPSLCRCHTRLYLVAISHGFCYCRQDQGRLSFMHWSRKFCSTGLICQSEGRGSLRAEVEDVDHRTELQTKTKGRLPQCLKTLTMKILGLTSYSLVYLSEETSVPLVFLRDRTTELHSIACSSSLKMDATG